ncbi:MAG TPA: hypothetical protein ENN67_05880, partial [Firmicutes bacterium]|nr:hypothetical protein [Bacillota bacterium]
SVVFGLDEPDETVLNSAGAEDIFIARYHPNSMLIWAKQAGGADFEFANALTSLSDDSIVLTGYFQNTTIFGTEGPNETTLTSIGDDDILLAKYNSSGDFLWAKQAGGIEEDRGYAITSLSDDSTVITGNFGSMATFGKNDPNEIVLTSLGSDDIFLARFNSDGSLDWAKSAGGTGKDTGFGITSFSNDSILITGYFYQSAIFGLGEYNETILKSNGYHDIFMTLYDENGTFFWSKGAGGPAGLLFEAGRAVTSLSDNSTILTGTFSDFATFGLGEPKEITLVSEGNLDAFIARFGP